MQETSTAKQDDNSYQLNGTKTAEHHENWQERLKVNKTQSVCTNTVKHT